MLALLNFTSFVSHHGYTAIFVLSVLQSCCIPTSSELTIGFAGVMASQGHLNLAAVILIAALGELVGAYIAWVIGRFGGRAVVDRYGKYILLSHHDLDRAEAWYDRHGPWGVFASRCVPVIRNFVAVPAGVAEVPLLRFGILTFLGSLVWDGAMAGIGYGVGGTYTKVMHDVSYAGYFIGAVVVIFLAVVIWHRWRSFHAATADGAPSTVDGAPNTVGGRTAAPGAVDAPGAHATAGAPGAHAAAGAATGAPSGDGTEADGRQAYQPRHRRK